MDRREFLRLAATGLAGGATLSACGETNRPQASRSRRPERQAGGDRRVLLAYFSRPGENYWNGGRRDLEIGNTEVLARKLADRLDCDLHRIEAAEPYADDYEETVARNVREQEADARPRIANPLDSIRDYETVLLASPIWNVRPPMIMATFIESQDFAGKTLLPLTTYAMSGLGSAPREYAQRCRGARIGQGLAVRGEEVRSADDDIEAWLAQAALPTFSPKGSTR
ncbi:MAG TPA: flavodoxin [Solirubrobacteraceae bacterium]|jgi:flavodoxin